LTPVHLEHLEVLSDRMVNLGADHQLLEEALKEGVAVE